MLARLAAWLDRVFWPGLVWAGDGAMRADRLVERQPCLTASEIVRRNGWDTAQLAEMRRRNDATLEANLDRATAILAQVAPDPATYVRGRARSLRVSLC